MQPSRRSLFRFLFAAGLALLLLGGYLGFTRLYADRRRAQLFEELRPVSLRNCQFARFGGPNDGGYLLCVNLLRDVQVAYSYGINGEDNWGCDVTTRLGIPVREYDCFNLKRPLCAGGQKQLFFHEECVSEHRQRVDGRPFDTVWNQLNANGDAGKRLLVKMDVEGAEWSALAGTPDETLALTDQLVMEMHHVDRGLPERLALIRRLKKYFYVANVHFNNWSCREGTMPFPAWAFQVLLINKRIAEIDPVTRRVAFENPLNARDGARVPDCQARWDSAPRK